MIIGQLERAAEGETLRRLSRILGRSRGMAGDPVG